ncbi:unnamed protein product [Closterium sp. Naga37s-1]|nr:unnamed protein product [Closterium sp. Naga37s-1]
MGRVHLRCLQQWIERRRMDGCDHDALTCEVCRSPYRLRIHESESLYSTSWGRKGGKEAGSGEGNGGRKGGEERGSGEGLDLTWERLCSYASISFYAEFCTICATLASMVFLFFLIVIGDSDEEGRELSLFAAVVVAACVITLGILTLFKVTSRSPPGGDKPSQCRCCRRGALSPPPYPPRPASRNFKAKSRPFRGNLSPYSSPPRRQPISEQLLPPQGPLPTHPLLTPPLKLGIFKGKSRAFLGALSPHPCPPSPASLAAAAFSGGRPLSPPMASSPLLSS